MRWVDIKQKKEKTIWSSFFQNIHAYIKNIIESIQYLNIVHSNEPWTYKVTDNKVFIV